MKTKRLDRRTFLRGAGGVTVALPLLEIMLDTNGALADGQSPKHFGIFFAGQSLGGDDDPKNFFIPQQVGASYTTSNSLKPLDKRKVREDVSVVSGLLIPTGTGQGQRDPEFHPLAHYPIIHGSHNLRPQEGADQIIGKLSAGATKFRTLNYQAPPNFYVPGYDFYQRDRITYQKNQNGSIQQVVNQISPKAAFDSLFNGFSGGANSAAIAKETATRRSILNLILADRDRLLRQLGASDSQRLTQHLDEISDLERRIASTFDPTNQTCQKLADPGADPAQGASYSNEFQRIRTFLDLIHMAYVCDLTRAATLMLTTAQCHISVTSFDPGLAGAQGDQHELGHGAGGVATVPAGTPYVNLNPALGEGSSRSPSYAMSLAHTWHVDHFAYLLEKMKATPEGTGTMLDNSALMMMFEGGHGKLINGPDDSDKPIGSHSTENIALLVAGRSGGLKSGQHIKATGTHPAKVTISAMKAVGYTSETLGETTGIINELFT